MALQFIVGLRNSMADTINTAANAGAGAAILCVYDGTKPATVATALSSNTLLAQIPCADPFAASGASSGTLTVDTSPTLEDASANATGTASWWRLYSSADGTTVSEANAIAQGTATATGGGGDITFNTVSFVSGGPVQITSWTIAAPGA